MRTRLSATRWLLIGAAWAAIVAVAACDSNDGVDVTTGGPDSGSGGGTGGSTTSGTGGESAGGGFVDPCQDVDCPAGEVCHQGMCVQGCSDTEPCGDGLSCCNNACVDVATDLDNCGMCDNACPQPPNVSATCEMGVCQLGACAPGFNDCDGISDNGCESMESCSCTPGDTQPCYPGPPGTENHAPCTGGTRTCNSTGTAWSLCSGFVLPTAELCGNSIDEDCNGIVDDVPDLDGDGWTACQGDCCETVQDCGTPGAVNPGAFEFVGNSVDDDCDPSTSDTSAPPACSTSSDFSAVTPQQMAQAMDLCQFTTQNPPLPQKKWGVVSAAFRLANGGNPSTSQLNNMQNWQAAVLQNFGTGGVVPQKGNTMAGISSGRMRDQNDPSFVVPNEGTDFGSNSQPPAAYLAAHGGQLPASQGCNGTCLAGSGANDSINLRLEIRVPTNALSFAYQFRFFTSEFWTFSCSAYNDFFLALLTSNAANLPPDKNISFDSYGNPLSVNNGFFDICQAKGCYSCPLGVGQLAGTGMQTDDPYAAGIQPTGGGTAWLQTTAPVVPGETMTLELMVFDVSDRILDSLVLLDAFEWSIMPSSVGTGPPG